MPRNTSESEQYIYASRSDVLFVLNRSVKHKNLVISTTSSIHLVNTMAVLALLSAFLALMGQLQATALSFEQTKRSVGKTISPNAQDSAYPVARTSHGTYRGTQVNDDVNAFLGVPYAQAPVGDLRFRPAAALPSATEDTDVVINTTQFGPVCWQFHYRTVMLNNTMETTPQSEDCLNLNVFVPRKHLDQTSLPVLLWAYGGAFSEGGASEPSMNHAWRATIMIDLMG